MSVAQFQQQLNEVFNGADNQTVQRLAQIANEYTEVFKAQQMTKEEYVELMEDLVRMANIELSTDHMHTLQHLNVAMNGLINLAKLA